MLRAFEEVTEDPTGDGALYVFVADDRVHQELLVEDAPVRAPQRTVPQDGQAPFRERCSAIAMQPQWS